MHFQRDSWKFYSLRCSLASICTALKCFNDVSYQKQCCQIRGISPKFRGIFEPQGNFRGEFYGIFLGEFSGEFAKKNFSGI